MYENKIFQQLEASSKFPKLPEAIGDILKLLQKEEELEIADLSRLMLRCDEIRKQLLDSVNSGYFNPRKRIENIEEAVIFLGLRTVKSLIIAFIIQTLFVSDNKKTDRLFDREKYLRHSLGTSIASAMLAEKTGLSKKSELFTYGLVHDMGIVVLDICLPEIMEQVVKLQHQGYHQIAAERNVMGVTHSDVGGWLCDKWGFPEDIRTMVEYHHKPLLAKNYVNETKIMNVGDIISTSYYERLLGIKIDHMFSKIILEAIGVTNDDLHEVGILLPQEVEKIYNMIIFKF